MLSFKFLIFSPNIFFKALPEWKRKHQLFSSSSYDISSKRKQNSVFENIFLNAAFNHRETPYIMGIPYLIPPVQQY
ncbi:MAG: hypothetical protein CL918_04815 [Deltaproteobacteria bacterium]|nr:hypothetical protein [Deltaproteobacteria bacterium]|tara:strand:+ start:1216 stop:1443 length:228 start_codon:yes stop_codon:yes gene_type:complete